MRQLRGGRWPDERQMLLLRAATEQGEAALAAWREWLATGRFDDIDGASFAMIPQVYEHVVAVGGEFEEAARLHGIQRRQWYQNRVAMHALAQAVGALADAGIEAMVLKGAALLLSVPEVSSSRGMSDVDLLVRPEDAARAAELLLSRGWSKPWQRMPDPAEAFELVHAVPLRHGSGASLDLHRQMLEDNRAPGIDSGAWKRARTAEVEGRKVRLPAPEDLLVGVCVHGTRATPSRTIRWVIDAVAVIEATGGAMDWELVVRIARRRRVSLAMAEALRFVRDEFGAEAPGDAIAALEGTRRGWIERLDYRAQGNKARPAWAVASTFTRYLRQAEGQGVVAGARKFPAFLRTLWGVERTRDIPMEGWRRLRALSAGRSYWQERRAREHRTG